MITNRINNASGGISWNIRDFRKQENHQKIIRRFLNSAIYVEKEVQGEMAPQRKTSSLIFDSDDSNLIISSNSNNNNNNTIRTSSEEEEEDVQILRKTSPESGYRTSNSSTERSFQTVVKATNFEHINNNDNNNNNNNNELRLSLSCLNTNRISCLMDPKEKQEIVKNWISKKKSEQKLKLQLEAKEIKRQEEQRQEMIKRERENFKKWLNEKKQEEDKKKVLKEQEIEDLKMKQAEKEKKKLESDNNYNIWLRRKRKDELEKKINEKLALLHMYEEKQKRLEENDRAYQDWLKNSKSKPKSLPLNKGLKSLCSSTSVTYINPIPWTPNIDQ